MLTRLIRVAAWLSLAAIIFVTVSPIGLRPHDVLPVDVDRALAFVVMACLFVLAYPRSWVIVAVALILGAAGIELMQELSPTRHARIDDALVKASGAAIGVILGWAANRLRDARQVESSKAERRLV